MIKPLASSLIVLLALNAAAATPAAAGELKPVSSQGVLKCDFGRGDRRPSSSDALTPLVRGAFTPIPLETVQLVDKKLTRKVMVQSVAAQKTETETVELVARLVNCGDKPLPIEARATFLREDMSPSEPTSTWQRVFLQPRSTGVYSEKSVARNPAHYLIEVRTSE